MSLSEVSVCYIIKNEELFLEASLRSVRELAKEIIVIDTGSSDRSVEIAKANADRVENFKWIDDFSAPRNFAASLAKSKWILFVDGDEILENEGAQKIREVIERESDIVAYGVLQRNYTNDRSNPGWTSVTAASEVSPLAKGLDGFADNLMMKLYRNHLGIQWEGVIHETIVGSCGKLGLKHLEIPVCILHHLNELKTESFRNEKKLYYLKLSVEKLKTDPHHENPWFEVAISLSNLGRYQEAEKSFKEALLRRPDWEEAKLFRARTLLQLERYAEAEILLRELLGSQEFSREALGHLSTALLYQKKFADCEAMIEKAVALGSAPLAIHVNAGTLFFERRDFAKCKFHLEEALKINPTDDFLKGALQKTKAELAK